MKQRLMTLLAVAGLVAGMTVAVPAATVLAATDPGCTALGGVDGAGTCNVSVSSTPASAVTVLENLHLLAGAHINLSTALTLTVGDATHPASLEMDKNSSIDGKGKAITINVPFGNMTMHGTAGTDKCGYSINGTPPNALPSNALGAQITSMPAVLATTITINVGDINHLPTPTGSFVMERCSVIAVNNPTGSAGTIVVNAGHDVDVDGLVLSESGLTGTGANQKPGGGPISIRTSCELTVSSTGVVSSKGRDPGADLVHLEGCDVTIDGLVQSTGPGHIVPNNPANHCDVHPHAAGNTDVGCIEIWAEELVISSTGEVNANINSTGAGGPGGTSYIDLFAEKEITVTGKTGASDPFSVHADSLSGTDTTPNTITVLSHTSTVTASGKAFSATDTANGSWGGTVNIQASATVTLTGATVQAAGHNSNSPTPPCKAPGSGACGAGGDIIVRSFNGAILWGSGIGNVSPDVPGAATSGSITLTSCGSTTIGANFGNAIPLVATGVCGGNPPLPAYVEAAFAGPNGDRAIWERCNPSTKSGMKFNDLNGNGAKDAGEPGLQNWPITITPPAGPAVTVLTDASGKYSFSLGGPGVYTVCEGVSPVAPATWVQTFPNAATIHAGETIINTCPAPNTRGYQFTLAGQVTLADNDFGNWVPPTKTGVKWNDVNGNGVRDAGDNGLPGWVIQALDATNVVKASATTDANGIYTLTFPTGGTFKVCEVLQAGFAQTFPNATTPDPAAPNDKVLLGGCPGGLNGYTVIVQSGSVLSNNDFGNHPPTFGPPDKTGLKWNDLNGNHVKDAGEPVLADWPIKLYGPGGTFPLAQSTTTAADGTYHFTIPSPGPWRVCEGPAPASLPGVWTQTFPQAATPPPPGESITTACPGPNTVGYQFTAVSGVNLVGDDFGNFQPTGCQKVTTLDIMNSAFPGNLGPDVNVLTFNGQSVQAAVDNASDLNHDGYIIIMVIAHSDFSLGGSANQKVVVSKDYTATPATNLPFGLFGCSVTLTGGGADPAIWIKDTAKGAPITINGRTSTIFVADLHGSNSAVGVLAEGTNRYLRNNCTGTCGQGANAIGIKVVGDNNTVHNGEAAGNTGDGIVVTGNGNLVTDGNAMSNGGHGFNITGNNNQLLKLNAGEKNKANTLDGVRVTGDSNTISENDAYNNGHWGVNVIGNTNTLNKNVAGDKDKGNGFGGATFGGYRIVGTGNQLTENKANANTGFGFLISGAGSTGNTLTKNESNTGASGGDKENTDAEYKFDAVIIDGGGNKKDNASFTSTAAGSYE